LIEKVIALPGFVGEKQPPRDIYTSLITNRWIIIKGAGISTIDDSPFV
jgi:hypothetical protein